MEFQAQPVLPSMAEQHLSPSDIVKIMILDRWKKMLSYYEEGNDLGFTRSTKTFASMLQSQLNEEEEKILLDLDAEEEKEIVAIRKQQLKDDIMSEKIDKQIKEIYLNYAERRMKILTNLIKNSSIIVRDVEIEFALNEDDLEIFRIFIERSGQINKTEEAAKTMDNIKIPEDLKATLIG